MNKLNDDSPMPFGAYKGKLMQDVPVGYLHWFYTLGNGFPEVKDYIERNLAALKMENKDLIWK